MKRTILSVVILLAVFALGMLVGGTKLQSVGTSLAVAAPAPVAMAVPIPQEHRCPSVHEAIRALESAERDMREARHDFCGHKHAAMEITHHAIEQLREAEGCAQCR
jgi:uncharacterized membrane protein